MARVHVSPTSSRTLVAHRFDDPSPILRRSRLLSCACLTEEGGLVLTDYKDTLDAWQRATEAALQQSEERFRAEWEAIAAARFRAVWKGTAEAMVLTDPDGIVLAVNPAFCTLYGRE